jgi:hypothetical protein
MTDALTMTVYAAAKFLAYSAWCALGLRRPGAVSVVASLRFGVEWGIMAWRLSPGSNPA